MSLPESQHDEVQELLDQFSLDGLTAEQAARLEYLAQTDSAVCDRYVRWAFVHAGLRSYASFPGSGDGMCDGGLGGGLHPAEAVRLAVGAMGDEFELLTRPEQPSATAGFVGGLHSTVGYFSQTGPFSYLVSALVMCVAVLAAWQYKIDNVRDVGNRVASSAATGGTRKGKSAGEAATTDNAKPPLAGRVTDTADCCWNARHPSLSDADFVAVGRHIELDSGLIEITYITGAKVILQGPVTFDVDTTGGLLTAGRLTGKLDTAAMNASLHFQTSRPFVIRTPSAVVTDLGTEFGVEVDRQGRTTSHVFRGSIKICPIADSTEKQSVVLKENDSARVEVDGDRGSKVQTVVVAPDRFVRNVRGRRIPLRTFNTGDGVDEQKPDPYWQIVAATNDANFKPQQALVTTVSKEWMPNSPEKAKWISLTPRYQQLLARNNAIYTFRTTFELGENALPETAVLKGWFVVDNCVRAIRLNGQKAEVPEHAWNKYRLFFGFTFDRGFVQGTNTLEIDVENIDPETHFVTSPMGLRVDLEGSVREKATK